LFNTLSITGKPSEVLIFSLTVTILYSYFFGPSAVAHEDKAIKRSDIVVVMVGPKTHKAPGVLKEVKMASEEGIKIVQVIGYRDGNYTAVPNAGRLYSWNWENLKNLLG
jgi:hypothetical protein